METNLQPQCITENIWLVPCLLNRDTNSFIPLFKPFSNNIYLESQFRNSWQDIEDQTLKELVQKNGLKHWKKIATQLNKIIYKGMLLRNSKQCRERWINHVDPELNKGKWTDAEDIIILESQLELGNKWSEISKKLNRRTENAVKNRWKCLLTKAKKTHLSSINPIEEYIRRKREGSGQDSIHSKNNRSIGFFPCTPLGDIHFSTIAGTFRKAYVPHLSPPSIQDISPSSLLFFNS